MFKKLFTIILIIFSVQTFAEARDYVPMFKVSSKAVKTQMGLQNHLVEDLNLLKVIFNKNSNVAIVKDEAQEEQIFNAVSSL